MDPVTLFLVSIAGLFLLGALGEVIFARTQIPDVVWLILAGILLGPVGGIVPREMLERISPFFAALTLIVVLFEGGSKLVLNDLVKAAPRASFLAVLGFCCTLVVIALLSLGFGALGALPDWSPGHGILLGAILGGSSSLIIMPSMTLAKVEERIANLVGLESALTDALCVVVTVAMIDVLVAGSGSAGSTALVLAKSFGIALGVGIAAGWMWIPVLRLLAGNPHGYPMTLAALILLYVVVAAMGGSAAMGILAFSVMVGNAEAIMRRLGFQLGDTPLEIDLSVRTAHAQISFIVKSFFFTFIGLMLSPPWTYLVLGVVFGLVLLAARVPVAWLATRGGRFTPAQMKMITVSLPRGMAAGVLATLPAYRGVPGTEDLPPMVFAAVLTSIVIFAVGFPLARRQERTATTQGTQVASPPEPSASPSMPGFSPLSGSEPPAPAARPRAAEITGTASSMDIEHPAPDSTPPPVAPSEKPQLAAESSPEG